MDWGATATAIVRAEKNGFALFNDLDMSVKVLKELMERRKTFPGHKGRPGKRGGSLPKGAVGNPKPKKDLAGASLDEIMSKPRFMDTDDYRNQRASLEENLDTVIEEVIDLTRGEEYRKVLDRLGDKELDAEYVKRGAIVGLRTLVENKPISVRRSTNSIDAILKSGRLKTQFETGTSAGYNNPEFRKDIEEVALGVPSNTDPWMRPVYGFVNTGYEMLDELAHFYGDVEYVLKKSVNDRVTFTVGDSLDEEDTCVATSVKDPQLVSIGSGSVTDNVGRISALVNEEYDELDCYIEAQIHGGVKLQDIDHVVLHGKANQRYDIRDKFEKAGIKTVGSVKSDFVESEYERLLREPLSKTYAGFEIGKIVDLMPDRKKKRKS